MSLNTQTQTREHVAICEFLAEEPLSVRPGEVMFAVPFTMVGMVAVGYEMGLDTVNDAAGLRVAFTREPQGSSGTNQIDFIEAIFAVNNVRMGGVLTSNIALQAGDIIRLNVRGVGTGTPPTGLSGTLVFERQ